METLAEQPLQTERHDLIERARNDAETWLAEVLDGSMRTPFEYDFDGRELHAQDGGALGRIFEDALVDARRLRVEDPQLEFEGRRRSLELDEYHEMLAMARGELPNTMVVVSDFPPELMHATHDVGGYNTTRKQTMLRVITYDNGRLRMYSQSLDGSNRQALEQLYEDCGIQPQSGELLGQRMHLDVVPEDQAYVVDRLTGAYDRNLAAQYGGQWYAGRPEPQHDTYSFVIRQRELIGHYVERQLSGSMTDGERYNIAALITKRFDQFKCLVAGEDSVGIVPAECFEQFAGRLVTCALKWELHQAGNEARASGQTFSGCGASVGPAGGELSATDQLKQAGYGNLSGEDKYGSLKFDCPKCKRTNTRPRGKLIPHCQSCGASVRC